MSLVKSNEVANSPSRVEVWKMFDEISKRYDLVNHLLSLGIDRYWRAKMAKFLPKMQSIRLLDLATGTGDQIFSIMKRSKRVKTALGIDLSQEMLRVGQKKLMKKCYAHQVSLVEGSAIDISLRDQTVECVTISFGIRNVVDVSLCMKEAHRVLTQGGRFLVLEFSLPKFKLLRNAHLFYLRRVLPFIGGLISKKPDAYSYLNQTIETFPYGENFCSLLKEAGFNRVKRRSLTFGIATLYIAEKI